MKIKFFPNSKGKLLGSYFIKHHPKTSKNEGIPYALSQSFDLSLQQVVRCTGL